VLLGVVVGYLMQTVSEYRAMTVHSHDVSHVCRQLVVNIDLTATQLVEYIDCCAVAKAGERIYKNQIYILDKGVVSDGVVGYVVMYIVNRAVVAYHYVV
jgi:hypothetical protein